jgi:hypothetical protein
LESVKDELEFTNRETSARLADLERDCLKKNERILELQNVLLKRKLLILAPYFLLLLQQLGGNKVAVSPPHLPYCLFMVYSSCISETEIGKIFPLQYGALSCISNGLVQALPPQKGQNEPQ